MKHEAASIVKIHQDIKMLQQDIDLKETALLGVTSIRTIEEVQSEDELLKAGMYVLYYSMSLSCSYMYHTGKSSIGITSASPLRRSERATHWTNRISRYTVSR